MRSLNTHTREGGLSVKIVLARFAPSKNANLSKRANFRLASLTPLATNRRQTGPVTPLSHGLPFGGIPSIRNLHLSGREGDLRTRRRRVNDRRHVGGRDRRRRRTCAARRRVDDLARRQRASVPQMV